jgi:RNA polymerase sigma-70 factor (ECF subfamily)
MEHVVQEPDTDQWQGILRGDPLAWHAFVANAAPHLLSCIRAALARLGAQAEATDVLQEVFLKLCRDDFRLLRGYDPSRARLSTWLRVLAARCAIDHLRRQGRLREALPIDPDQLPAQPNRPARIDLPADLLTPRQTLLLRLLYEHDLDVPTAAAFLHISEQSVRSLHHKAMQRLRAAAASGLLHPARG